jgi:hypothetical protein
MIRWIKRLFSSETLWPKNFDANEVMQAIEKQTPKTAREKRLQQLLNEDKPRKPAVKKATTRSKTMPLKKSASPKAFKENVKAEVKAGKKPAQAVAIAYSVKREAAKKTTEKGKK